MKFQPRRGLGKFLIAISVVFMIAALYTLFLYVDEGDYSEAPRVIPVQRAEPYSDDILGVPNEGPEFPYWYTWPYRWLSKPLAMIGMFLLLTGFFIGYHDDISQIF